MKHLTLIIITIAFTLSSYAQTDSLLIGKWRSCTSLELSEEQDCAANHFVTYDLHEDGTYDDSRAYISMGKRGKYHGQWSYDGAVLIIDAADENGMTAYPQHHSITWINDNLFYSQGNEGEGGPVVYTYFRRE